MAGFVLGRINVLLSAEASKFLEAMNRARTAAMTSAKEFLGLGQSAQRATSQTAGLASNFGKTQGTLLALSNAAGMAGGKFAKLGGAATSLLLTGLNPIAIAATAAGIGIGMLIERSQRASEELAKQREQEKELQEAILARVRAERSARTGQSEEQQSVLELRRSLQTVEREIEEKTKGLVTRIRATLQDVLRSQAGTPIVADVQAMLDLPDAELINRAGGDIRLRVWRQEREVLEGLVQLRIKQASLESQISSKEGPVQAQKLQDLNQEAKARGEILLKTDQEAEAKKRLAVIEGESARSMARIANAVAQAVAARGELLPVEKVLLDMERDKAEAFVRGAESIQKETEQLRQAEEAIQALIRSMTEAKDAEGKATGKRRELTAEEAEAIETIRKTEEARIRATFAMERETLQIEEQTRRIEALAQIREIDKKSREATWQLAQDEAEWRRRDERQEADRLSHFLEEKLVAEEDSARAVRELRSTDAELAIHDAKQMYSELLMAMKSYGVDARALQAEVDRRVAETEGLRGDDPIAGFQAQISVLRRETLGLGSLGAKVAMQMTDGLANGVVGALEQVVRKTKSAKEAFRDFGIDFAFQLARMIQQQLLFNALIGIFPGLGGGATGPAGGVAGVPGAAFGGNFKVMGSGGFDSVLAMLRVSPGEVVSVGGGVGDGGQPIVLENHLHANMPVYADEVAAGMSKGAMAGIVATAVRRGSRRGGRPVE